MNDLWQIAFVLLSVFVLIEGVAVFALARAIGTVQLRLGPEPAALQTPEGLPLYAEAPALSAYDLRQRRPVTLEVSKGRWALVFVSATCGVCRQLVRDAGRVSRDRSWNARVVVISRGSHEQNEVLAQLGLNPMLLSDPNGDMHMSYMVESTPYAFLVEDGQVRAKGIVNRRDQIEALLEGETSERPSAVWVPAKTASADGAYPTAEAVVSPAQASMKVKEG